ncbi:MAG TPA: sulfurtransferase TusA family protein [Candidatus Nanoarchaeia archaeon]|nr:sulfurtransferase TusA family protein [Candidatus Nanoarchaeia archaeon]
MDIDVEKLDTSGQVCPMPVVLTKRKLESLNVGQVLEVTGDCAPSLENIEKWAKTQGHEVLEATKSGDHFSIKIRKH